MPPVMVHVGGGDEDAAKLWKSIEGVSVLPKLQEPSLSPKHHPKVRANPEEMGLRLKNTPSNFGV